MPAAGEKITKFTAANTGTETTQNYVSGIEYNGIAVEAVYHEEGRLVPNGTAWHYEYTLKDHLGNSRVMFRANGSTAQVLQENHYYPFGMEMEGAWTAQVGTENKYQYNGKELVEDFGWNWSDYGARGYDAAVGRWWSVDPLANKMPLWAMYSYSFNNPIRYIDPDGKFPIPAEFRANYPLLTKYIETQLQGYLTGSERIHGALLKYSGGNLTLEQIADDFDSKKGPTLAAHQYDTYGGTLEQGGEYVHSSKTIRFSVDKLTLYETLLRNPNTEIQQWGIMDFVKLFVNEYVHYGDALDGIDVIQDENGNIINNPDVGEGAEPAFPNIFEEGNEAANELFPLPSGRQNYHLYNLGRYIDPRTSAVHAEDKSKIDKSMIPSRD
ncbi:MAG: RHS repeat domain-containing protein [Saprospiraceae bacterium]